MKYSFILFFLLLMISCSKDFKKYRDINNHRIYELQCNEKYFLSLDNCDCKNLPKNYFIPIGDSRDHFYVIYFREEKNKLNIYSLYDEIKTYGNIKDSINFHIIEDNSFFINLIEDKDFKQFKGYSSGDLNH